MKRKWLWNGLVWLLLFVFADLWAFGHHYPLWSTMRMTIELVALVFAGIALFVFQEKVADCD